MVLPLNSTSFEWILKTSTFRHQLSLSSTIKGIDSAVVTYMVSALIQHPNVHWIKPHQPLPSIFSLELLKKSEKENKLAAS